jgi:1-acyl-sn-glycerol-3-phosphate acyltransferase
MQIVRLSAGSAVRSLSKTAAAVFGRALEILYGVYFALVFSLWIVPSWAIVALFREPRAAGRFTRSALKVLFALIGCSVRVVGKEHMETPGGKMFAANHTSYFDVLPLIVGLGVPYRFVAKMEIRGMPFIGTFLRRGGHLSFNRTDANARLRQADEMEKILCRGESVFVFPEGTFTAEDGIRPFQLGAFKAAVAAGVPIIPVSLAGTRKFLRDGTYLPRPTSVTITLSPPIYPHPVRPAAEGKESSDWHELIHLRDETRAAIARYVPEPLL